MSQSISNFSIFKNKNKKEAKHPDYVIQGKVQYGNTDQFREIGAVYLKETTTGETLSDPNKKAAYDNPRPQMGGFQFHHGPGGFPPGFDDFFEHAFGGMFGRRGPQKNRSLNLQTQITLEEAFWGKDFVANVVLPSGRDQVIEVKIPKGIQNGNTIRLSGIGDDSVPNLPRGDIHLTVHVKEHHEFHRQNDDLIKQLDINCLDAIIGKTININTIENKTLEINIQPGIQHGQFISVPGHGMPNINQNTMRGRLLLNVNIVIPTNLTESQKQIIKEILK